MQMHIVLIWFDWVQSQWPKYVNDFNAFLQFLGTQQTIA